ncbi:unnamed protein product [Urochloa decumbens]|uniref:glutathione transferase n=1 Tax=Urochloa decumbens TaxID=240449 RepID=A0ABC9G494_9POAL
MVGLGTGAPIVQVYHEKSIILPDVSRVLACLYEKDIKFETHTASYKSLLRLQASSHAPVPFYDGPTFLEESRGICRYIAEKYEHQGYPFLLGKDALERASVEQWLHNEEHAFNPPSQALYCHLAFPLDEEDSDDIDLHTRKLEEVLEVYEQRLSDSRFLAGNKFTLADLVHLPNSHYITSSDKFVYLYDSRKNVSRWWEEISTRKSWQQVLRDMKRVEEQNKQEELKKQQQRRMQKEHPRTSGHPIRIYSRKQTSTEPRTILVPPADTVSPSSLVPPLPTDTFPDEALVSSSQSTPTADKSSAVLSKETVFNAPDKIPPPSVQSTPTTSIEYPIPGQSIKDDSSPTTAKKPPLTDAAMSSTKDASIPEPTAGDLHTRYGPSSSVSNNLDVFDYHPSHAGTDDETPYIEPTTRRTSETFDAFSGSNIAAGHTKTSSIPAKEEPDQSSVSDFYKSDSRAAGIDSRYKESIPYSGRTTRKLEPTDTSASKPHTSDDYHRLQAEQWHTASTGLHDLKQEADYLTSTQQGKPSKDVKQYPSQDSEQATSHPVPEEPMSKELVQRQEYTTRRPYTDQRSRGIVDDKASSDQRSALLLPSTQEHDETPSRQEAAKDARGRIPSQAGHRRLQAEQWHTASTGSKQEADHLMSTHQQGKPSKDVKQYPSQDSEQATSHPAPEEPMSMEPVQRRENTTRRPYADQRSRGTVEDKASFDQRSKLLLPSTQEHDATPSMQEAAKDARDRIPSQAWYPGGQDTNKQPRDPPSVPRQRAAQDARGTLDESKAADSTVSSESSPDASRASLPRKDLDGARHTTAPFQKRYPATGDTSKQARDKISTPWQMTDKDAEDTTEETKFSDSSSSQEQPLYIQRADAPPWKQGTTEDHHGATSAIQEKHANVKDTTGISRDVAFKPKKMIGQNDQDTFKETKSGSPSSLRDQQTDTWQAASTLPEQEVNQDDLSAAPPYQTRYPSSTTPSNTRYQIAKDASKQPRGTAPTPKKKSAQDDSATYEESNTADEVASTEQPLSARRAPVSPQRQEVQKRYPDDEDDIQAANTASSSWQIAPDNGKDISEETKLADSTTSTKPLYRQQAAPPLPRQVEVEDAQSKVRQRRVTIPEPQKMVPRVAQDTHGERKTAAPGEQFSDRLQAIPQSRPAAAKDAQSATGETIQFPGIFDTTNKTRDAFEETKDPDSTLPLLSKEPTSKVQPSLQEAASHGGLSSKPSTIEQWQRASVPLNGDEIGMATIDQKLTPMSQQATPSAEGVNQMARESGEKRVELHVPTEAEISGVQSASPSFPGASTAHHATTDDKFVKKSTVDERIGEPTKMQTPTPDSARAHTKRPTPMGHEIGGSELVSIPDGQISEAAKTRRDQAPLQEDVQDVNLPTHDVAKDTFKETKIADSTPSSAKPMYTQRSPPTPRHAEVEDTSDKGTKSREIVPDRQKMVERRAGTTGEQLSDSLKATHPSRQAPAEDALSATGDTIQSSDILDTSKKARGTYEEAKGPGSMLSKAQSLGAQDAQHTTGESTTPTAGQRKDVSTKPQPDVQDGPNESKLSVADWHGLGTSEGKDAIETETTITGKKPFSMERIRETSKKSESTTPKAHPTDSQGSVEEKTSSIYQKKPMVAQDSLEQAQTIPVGEKADGYTPKHQRASDDPNTFAEKLNASEPVRAKTHADFSTEEPYREDTTDDQKMAPPLLSRELTSQVQPPSEPSHDAAFHGDLSTKPSTIDQWRRASAPLHDVTTSSGDDEVAMSTVDQKPTPMRLEESDEQRVEPPVPIEAETSGFQRASPSFPGASMDDHATIGDKLAKQSIIDERVGKPIQMQTSTPDAKQSIIDERVGKPIQMQTSTPDAHPASEPTKRSTPEGHGIGDSDGQISEATKARDDPATVHEDVYGVNLPTRDAGKDTFKETKVADSTPSSAKPMYIQQPANTPLRQTQVGEPRDKSMQSRETIPEQQKMMERKAGISGEQSSDRQKAIRPSRQVAADEDAPTGDTIQSPYIPDGSKKPRGTFEEAIGPGSTLPKAQALDAQDSQLTKGESTMPNADQRKDWKDAKDDETIMTEEKSFSTERLREMFQESESTTPKTQSTDSQDYGTVDKPFPVYQKGPLAAQIIQAGEKVDSSTPEHLESSGSPYTYDDKLSASAPARADIHDDRTAEEPYKTYTSDDQKVAPSLSSEEPESQMQPLSEPFQRAVPDGDSPSKSFTIDQWQRASAPLRGVSTDSGDAEVAMPSNNDQKSRPVSQEATLSSPVPIRAETSDVGRTVPSLPEAARSDDATIDDKFAKQSNIDERMEAPKQMQEPITAAHPASASINGTTTPDGHEAGDLKLDRTTEGQRLKAAKATQDPAIIHEDVHDASLSTRDAAINEKAATHHASGDQPITGYIHDRQAWSPAPTQAQPTVVTPHDPDSSQYAHTGDSGKTELTKPIVTDQEETAPIAGSTSMDPQRAGTLPAEQKSAPLDKGSTYAVQPLSPVEPIKTDSNVSAADYSNAPQMIFRQQARPSAPSTIGIPASDTQGVIGKIQEVTPDNSRTDDLGKPFVPSEQQVSHASQAIPDQEEMASPPGATVSPTSDTQLASDEPRSKEVGDLAPSTQIDSTEPRIGDSIAAAPDQAKDSQTTPEPSTYTQRPSGTLQEDEHADNSGEVKSSKPPSVVREGKPAAAVPASAPDTQHGAAEPKFALSGQSSARTTFLAPTPGTQYGTELPKADVDEQKFASSGQEPSLSTEPTKEDTDVAATDQTSTLEKIIDQNYTTPAPDEAKTPFSGTPDASRETQKSTNGDHIDEKPPGQGRVSSYRHVSEPPKGPTPEAHSDVDKETTLGSSQAETLNTRPDPTPIGSDAHLSSDDVPATSSSPETQDLQGSAYARNVPADSLGKIESPGHLPTDQAMAPIMSPSVPSVTPLGTIPGTNSVQPPRQASIASTVDLESVRDTQHGIPEGEAIPAEQKFSISDQEPHHTLEPLSSAESRKEEANAAAGDQPNVPQVPGKTVRNEVKAPSSDAREALQKNQQPSHAVLPEQTTYAVLPEVDSSVVDKETTLLSSQAQTSAAEPDSTPTSGDVSPTSSLQNQDMQPPVTTQAPTTQSLQGSAPTQDDYLSKFEPPKQASTDQVTEPVTSSTAPSDAPQGQDSAQSIQPPLSTEPTEDNTVVTASNQTKDMETITHQQAITPAPDTANTFLQTDQKAMPPIAGPTSMEPQLAGTLPAEVTHSEQKPSPSEKGSARAAQRLSPVEPINTNSNVAAADYTNAQQMIFREQARSSAPSTIGIPTSDIQGVIGKIEEGTLDNHTDDSAKPSVPNQEQVSHVSQAIPGKEEMASPPGATVYPTSATQFASAEVQEVSPDDQQAVESSTPLFSSGKQGSLVVSTFVPGEVGPVEKKFAPSDQGLPHSAEQPTSGKPRKEQTGVPTAEQIKEQPTIIGQQDTLDPREVLTSEDVLDTTPTHGDVHLTGSIEPERRSLSVQGEEPKSATQAPPPLVAKDSQDPEDISTNAMGNVQSLKPSTTPDARGITPGSTPRNAAVTEQISSPSGKDSADHLEPAFSLGPRNEGIRDSAPSALLISSTNPSREDSIVAVPDQAKDSQTTPSQQGILSTQRPSGKVQENIPGDNSGKDKSLRPSAVREGIPASTQLNSTTEPRSKEIGDLVPSTQLNSTTEPRNGDAIIAAPDQAEDYQTTPGQQVRLSAPSSYTQHPSGTPQEDEPVDNSGKVNPSKLPSVSAQDQVAVDEEKVVPSGHFTVPAPATQYGTELQKTDVNGHKVSPLVQDSVGSVQPSFSSEPTKEDSVVAATDQTGTLENIIGQNDTTPAPDKAKTPFLGNPDASRETQKSTDDDHTDEKLPGQSRVSPYSHVSESPEGSIPESHSDVVYKETTLGSSQAETSKSGPDSTIIGGYAHLSSGDVAASSSLPETQDLQGSAYAQNVPTDSLGKSESPGHLSTDQAMEPRMSPSSPSVAPLGTVTGTNSFQLPKQASLVSTGDLESVGDTQHGIPRDEGTPVEQKFAISDQESAHTMEPPSSAEPSKEEAHVAAGDRPNAPQGLETTVQHQVKAPSPDARGSLQKDQQPSRDDDHISNPANQLVSEEKASHAGRASEGPISEVSGAVDKKMTLPSSQVQTASTRPESTPMSGGTHISSVDVPATSSLQNEEVDTPAATRVPTPQAPLDSAATQNIPADSLGEIIPAALSDAPQGTESDQLSHASEPLFSAEPSNKASHAGPSSESREGITPEMRSPVVDAKTILPSRQVRTAKTGPDSTPVNGDVPDRSPLQNQEAQPSAATQVPTVQAEGSASTNNEPVDSLGDIKSPRQLPTDEVVAPTTSFAAPSDSSQGTEPGDQAKTVPHGDLPTSQVVGQSESADSKGMDSQKNRKGASTDENPKMQQQIEQFNTGPFEDSNKEADGTVRSNISTTFEELQKQPSWPKQSMQSSDEPENQQQTDHTIVQSLEGNGNQAEQTKAHDTETGGPEDMEASENTNQKNNRISQEETSDHSRKEASGVQRSGENTKDAPNSTEDAPGDVQAISKSMESSRFSEESKAQLQSEDKTSEPEAQNSKTGQPRGDIPANSSQNNSIQSQVEASDKSVEQPYPGIQNKDRDSSRLDDSADPTKHGDVED